MMGELKFQLYCTWHVNNAWQKNLNRIAIDEDDTRSLIYTLLRTLLGSVSHFI